jgi:hypothetical protein
MRLTSNPTNLLLESERFLSKRKYSREKHEHHKTHAPQYRNASRNRE